MGVFYETLPPSLAPWLLSQKIFWVATAPLSSRGHVNVSPKAGAPFGLLDTHTHAHASADAGAAIRFFWYLDLTGSGTETMAHLAEPGNGRVTVLFSAFEGGPRILRLWGRGTVLENGTREFGKFVEENCAGGTKKLMPGARGVVLVEVGQVGTSCGFSVPFFEYKGHRETLNEFFAKKARRLEEGGRGEESMDRYVDLSTLSLVSLPPFFLSVFGFLLGGWAADDDDDDGGRVDSGRPRTPTLWTACRVCAAVLKPASAKASRR